MSTHVKYQLDRWLGKTAVVTGATGGIGSAICESLSRAGMKVVGLDMKNIPSNNGDKSSNVQYRKCDVKSLKEIEDTFRWVEECMGGTHVLINCAGYSSNGQITDGRWSGKVFKRSPHTGKRSVSRPPTWWTDDLLKSREAAGSLCSVIRFR